MREPSQPVYEFGPFALDSGRRLLLRDGAPQALAPKVLDTLLALVEHRDRVLSKDELLKCVWGDTIVEEGGLTRNISLLRKTLGETPDDHRFIVTVPARGYRFVAEVRIVADDRTAEANRTANEAQPPEGRETGPLANFEAPPVALRSLIEERSHRWPVAGVVAALATAVLVTTTLAYRLRPAAVTAPTRPPITSIAVLPLDNLSGDPAQEYFADGMTESLIGHLARVRALKVVSRTSVMRFKRARPPLPEIGQTLGVDAVVEGSVQRVNGRVRISIQLIDARADAHVWAREYERQEADVLTLQREVARAVADEIRIQVSDRERAAMSAGDGTTDPAAHQQYLLGRFYLWKRLDDDLVRAIDHFERATRLDPGYAAAYAGISHAWWWRAIVGPFSFTDVEAGSRAPAQKALELDPRLPEALVSIGRLKYGHDWDWTGAQRDFRRALEIDPNNLDALFFSGMVCMALGCFEEAIAHIQRAAELDPLSSEVQSAYGRILYRARRFEEAAGHLNQAVELEPRNAGAYVRLAQVYREMGRYEDALRALGQGRTSGAERMDFSVAEAHVYARMGNVAEARRLLDSRKEIREAPTDDALDVAAVHAALGEKDEAFQRLFRNIDTRGSWAAYTKTDPAFDPLHADSRWPVLLRRLNLPLDNK